MSKQIRTWIQSENRRREHETYGKWIYDHTCHIYKTYKRIKLGRTKMLCGIKVTTYALNYASLKEVTCKKCKELYKKGKR